jgi:hypothetical protein
MNTCLIMEQLKKVYHCVHTYLICGVFNSVLVTVGLCTFERHGMMKYVMHSV